MTAETGDAMRPPVPERPLLRGEKVWLRPLEERDLGAYVAGINDTEVGGIAGYAAPQSLDEARGWLDHVREKAKKGDEGVLKKLEALKEKVSQEEWRAYLIWKRDLANEEFFQEEADRLVEEDEKDNPTEN